jgi:hypothetical protein
MPIISGLDQIPVWLLCAGMLAAVAVSVQIGMLVGRRHRAGRAEGKPGGEEGIGAVVGALLGLLAFMLAFTFGMAADRRVDRRRLLVEEVNSIGTTYLRAGLIPEPYRSEARRILRRYVDLRLEAAEEPEKLPSMISDSQELHRQLWQQAEALADVDLKNADITSLFVDSVNETIDLQTTRLAVGSYRIPVVIWSVFGVLTVLSSLTVGYNFGLQSGSKNALMTAMLALSFSTVTFLIFDLDHGNEGWLKVNQQPMYDLRQQLASESPANEANR